MHVATEIQCTKQETNMAHFWSRQKRLAVGFLSNIIIFETVRDSLVRELPVHSCFKVMMGSESCACIYFLADLVSNFVQLLHYVPGLRGK